MNLKKIQVATLAIMLVTIPLFGMQDVSALGVRYKITRGNNISLERQEVVAKGDKVMLEAKFFGAMDADSYVWNWDVCGTKSTSTGTNWYASKNYTAKNVGNCVVKVEGQAIYEVESIGGEVGDGVIILGDVSDTLTVLPSETIAVNISGPSSASVGQLFWLEPVASFPAGYNVIRLNWKASGACKGSSESTTKIGETGESKGTCTMTLNLRAEYPNKVLKGVAVKSITIN